MISLRPKCLFIGVALAMSACATDHTSMGSVSMPVETIGTDGATYRLPADTRLAFQSMSTANYDVSLDGNTSAVTFVAEEGSYLASIYNTDADYQQTWPLTRVASDGTTSTVDAMLLTPQPLGATVVAHQSTSLSFEFAIATGGTVTFGHGTVTVSIGVDQQHATSFTASAHGDRA